MVAFRDDVRRYFTVQEQSQGVSKRQMIARFIRNQPLWMIFLYRFGRWLHLECRLPVVRPLLKVIFAVVSEILEMVLGIHINVKAKIGKGLYIGHYGGIWIGPVTIGDYCNLSQEVTIGIGGTGSARGLPVIGSRVFVGPGAKIFGKISIGDNVAIGANAVVSKDIPENAVVLGNPGRIVGYGGSEGLIDLDDDEKAFFSQTSHHT